MTDRQVGAINIFLYTLTGCVGVFVYVKTKRRKKFYELEKLRKSIFL